MDMTYTWMRVIPLFEAVLAAVKPGHEEDEEIVECRKQLEESRRLLDNDMREHLDILEDCLSEVTAPPWCAFSDSGEILAVMAAGRPGDVFKFEEPPKEADAHFLLLNQPHYVKAMIDRIRHLETEAKIENRWTKVKAADG